MSRRYLSLPEAESSVISGKSVECFLGMCQRGGAIGVRWLSIDLSRDRNHIRLCRYDTADIGTTEYVDLYEFGPLDPNLQLDEADEMLELDEFSELWSLLERCFPGSTMRLVNAGVAQEEYRSYKAKSEA